MSLDNQIYEYECTDAGVRIDKYITIDGITRAHLKKLIEDGHLSVNGNIITKTNYKTKSGDKIVLTIPTPKELDIRAEDIKLDIVYEDDNVIVVNKPQGMVVHPACGNYSGTLVNALMYHYKDNLSGINGVIRPGIVHRIDKDTSGLLLVAKTNEAHLSLAEQIKNKTVTRRYVAIASGIVNPEVGIIDAPIGRHPTSRLKMAVTAKNSKNAITHYKTIEQFSNATLVECKLETGRTHQIRVHMQYIGHPLLGDPLYNSKNPYKLSGQALHAQVIGFIHPITKEYMEFTVNPPSYFYELIDKLRNGN